MKSGVGYCVRMRPPIVVAPAKPARPPLATWITRATNDFKRTANPNCLNCCSSTFARRYFGGEPFSRHFKWTKRNKRWTRIKCGGVCKCCLAKLLDRPAIGADGVGDIPSFFRFALAAVWPDRGKSYAVDDADLSDTQARQNVSNVVGISFSRFVSIAPHKSTRTPPKH